MDKCKLGITNEKWTYGSYRRKDYKKPMIYTFHQYKDFSLVYNLSAGKTTVIDGIVEDMAQDGFITLDQKEKYEKRMLDMFTPMDKNDEPYIEDLYEKIQQERRNMIGCTPIVQEQELRRKRTYFFDPIGGIDQRKKKRDLQEICDSVIMILTQTELSFLMEEDMKEWHDSGKDIYLLVNQDAGYDIPNLEFWSNLPVEYDIKYLFGEKHKLDLGNLWGTETLDNQIKHYKTCLFFYGSDGFLQCKNLTIPAVVHGIPTDYFTKSMTNQHSIKKAVVAYVAPNFDITRWVPLIEKTRISYWQLARLWEDSGDSIYHDEPEQLYMKYPQYFLNIYETGPKCAEASKDYPLQFTWSENEMKKDNIMAAFDRQKDEAIAQYINQQDNVKYCSTYFDENGKETEIPWGTKEQKNGILVQAVRVKRAQNAYVHFCKEGETVRNVFEKQPNKNQMSILSNFLFFLTPKLAGLYNELRKDKPMEMLPYEKGHLDYMLYEKDGKRTETFPLFQKACIGLLNNGQFLIFHFRLGGGKIQFFHSKEEETVEWEKENVNPRTPPSNLPDICLYTPEYAKGNGEEDIKSYRMFVGEGRFNIVMVQNRILCIRKGEVVLSSVGVVLSLSSDLGEKFKKILGLKPLEDGYYDSSKLNFTVNLNPPEEVTKETWSQLRWAYGGGMTLIKEGINLCDDGKMRKRMEQEGWMSPLSRQTQESALHVMEKHPRTAIGITRTGNLVLLVFSGRTKLSVGADYNEMCQIARKLFPNIWSVMNVDGGGSAMLGIAVNRSFMELSYPATSFESCAGMVRPINTIFCIE